MGGMQPLRRETALTVDDVIRSMLIRMTAIGSTIAAFLAGAAVAVGGMLAGSSTDSASHTALVIDAAAGRDGRSLVDARLRDVDATVRLPRSTDEALANVRYFAAQGYRVVVSGPQAGTAAREAGVSVVHASDLAGAVAAVGR
jgi:hypothetical protein